MAIDRCPCSLMRVAASSSEHLSRMLAYLISIGRFTPVTISTPSRRNASVTFVAVPPNMSVRIRTPPPGSTSAIACSTARRACGRSSSQPMVRGFRPSTFPTMRSSARTSSKASPPWVTTSAPKRASPRPRPRSTSFLLQIAVRRLHAYPRAQSARLTSSAMATDRCRPPVHPTATVR